MEPNELSVTNFNRPDQEQVLLLWTATDRYFQPFQTFDLTRFLCLCAENDTHRNVVNHVPDLSRVRFSYLLSCCRGESNRVGHAAAPLVDGERDLSTNRPISICVKGPPSSLLPCQRRGPKSSSLIDYLSLSCYTCSNCQMEACRRRGRFGETEVR